MSCLFRILYFKILTEWLRFVGGLQAIGELLQVDCEIYGLTSDHYSVTLRRYAGMALTNLTFGDVANKVVHSIQYQIYTYYCNFIVINHDIFVLQATLCSMKGCMRAMVAQLKSESEDLQQVNWVSCIRLFHSNPIIL